MGSARFARTWFVISALFMFMAFIFNVYLGVAYEDPVTYNAQHIFLTVMLPPILLFTSDWNTMYAWYLRKCKERQPGLDAEYQTRLMVIVLGGVVLFSLYVTVKDYALMVRHISSFDF